MVNQGSDRGSFWTTQRAVQAIQMAQAMATTQTAAEMALQVRRELVTARLAIAADENLSDIGRRGFVEQVERAASNALGAIEDRFKMDAQRIQVQRTAQPAAAYDAGQEAARARRWERLRGVLAAGGDLGDILQRATEREDIIVLRQELPAWYLTRHAANAIDADRQMAAARSLLDAHERRFLSSAELAKLTQNEDFARGLYYTEIAFAHVRAELASNDPVTVPVFDGRILTA